MTLLRDGETYEIVTLNASNGWKHQWNRLTDGHTWVSVETDVPDGYTMSVDQENTTTTITTHILRSSRPSPAPTSNKWHGLPWHRLAEALSYCYWREACAECGMENARIWPATSSALDCVTGLSDWSDPGERFSGGFRER